MCAPPKRPTHAHTHTQAHLPAPPVCPRQPARGPAGVPGVTGCPRREPGAESRAGPGAVRGAERPAPLRGAPPARRDVSAARAKLADREKPTSQQEGKKKIKNIFWNLTLENEFDACLSPPPTISGVSSSFNPKVKNCYSPVP